jgi:Ca-activated chloride channel family protein
MQAGWTASGQNWSHDGMTFIWPLMLLSLLMVPLGLALYLRLQKKRQLATAALGSLGVARDQAGRYLGKRRHVPPTFFLSGLTLLLFGMARPEAAVSLPRVEGTVILAFDVSQSMAAEDMEPSRMEAAKQAARVFVENQPSTVQIGVVAFSNGGLVIQQATDDQAAVLGTIERLSPQGGTSLGQGIFTALNAIAGKPIAIDVASLEEDGAPLAIEHLPSAVVVLLTDGENTGPPDPQVIAQVAAEAGVRIYPIGIGRLEGAVLEIDGFNIVTRLDETALKEIAGLTNGEYFHAEDETALQEIYENIDLRLTIAGENVEITAIIAGISALLLLAGAALSMAWFGRMP